MPQEARWTALRYGLAIFCEHGKQLQNGSFMTVSEGPQSGASLDGGTSSRLGSVTPELGSDSEVGASQPRWYSGVGGGVSRNWRSRTRKATKCSRGIVCFEVGGVGGCSRPTRRAWMERRATSGRLEIVGSSKLGHSNSGACVSRRVWLPGLHQCPGGCFVATSVSRLAGHARSGR